MFYTQEHTSKQACQQACCSTPGPTLANNHTHAVPTRVEGVPPPDPCYRMRLPCMHAAAISNLAVVSGLSARRIKAHKPTALCRPYIPKERQATPTPQTLKGHRTGDTKRRHKEKAAYYRAACTPGCRLVHMHKQPSPTQPVGEVQGDYNQCKNAVAYIRNVGTPSVSSYTHRQQCHHTLPCATPATE